MCRLLIVLNYSINNLKYIDTFLLQSITEKNTPGLDNNRDFNYHLDGYGFIFYISDKISIYKSSLMYKNDNNFNFIKSKIKDSQLIIAHIRATKTEFNDNICYNNTHPFWFKDNYWCHNGSINPFNEKYLLQFVDEKFKKNIIGNTDSEILFYIFLSIKNKVKEVKEAWFNFFSLLKDFKNNNFIISANIIYSNKDILFVSRFINNDETPPSLYFDEINKIISSEPITDNYSLVKNNSYIMYDIKNKNIEKNYIS